MRRILSLAVVGLLLIPAEVPAQEAAAGTPAPAQGSAAANGPDVETSNFFDLGARGTLFSSGSDHARFERYRDLRNGPTLDVFRYKKDTDSSFLTVQADHVGYRDQRYSATYDNFGKLKVSFLWDQIPLYFSNTTATLFSEVSPGVLRLDDSIQAGLQNKTTTLAAAVGQAQPFDLRQQRDIFDMKVRFSATPNLDVNVAFRSTTKTGGQPWAGTFGFSDAVELTMPLDTRTTDLGTSLEWSNSRGLARVGYDGSFFRNNVGALVWDNPLRVSDSPTAGPQQGRMSLWPDSNMNSANATGALNLPRHSRATAYLSVGNWTQNSPLIPITINSALTPIALDRATADAKATVTAMTYSFTSKPTDALWLSARYRSYDFDNRTPVFNATSTVAYDTTVEPGDPTTPYSFTRRTFDADASYTLLPFTAVRLGYTREGVDETFRTFSTTTENTGRVSIDSTRLNWLTIRAVYEHAKRVGSGLDEQALDDIGEQVSLRQFDISDRTSNRLSAMMLLTPVSSLGFNASVSAGNEDRPASVLGLRSNDNRSYSIGMDFVPGKAVSLGASYEYEKFTTGQTSRQANPGAQFDDPTRNWTTDAADNAHTAGASLDLIKLWPKTDLRFGYNYSRAQSTYVYGLALNSPLPPVVQLPPVRNELHRGTADMRYYVTSRLAAGLMYWYERYNVDDFARSEQTLTGLAQPSFLTLGYILRPYTANTITARLTYLW